MKTIEGNRMLSVSVRPYYALFASLKAFEKSYLKSPFHSQDI